MLAAEARERPHRTLSGMAAANRQRARTLSALPRALNQWPRASRSSVSCRQRQALSVIGHIRFPVDAVAANLVSRRWLSNEMLWFPLRRLQSWRAAGRCRRRCYDFACGASGSSVAPKRSIFGWACRCRRRFRRRCPSAAAGASSMRVSLCRADLDVFWCWRWLRPRCHRTAATAMSAPRASTAAAMSAVSAKSLSMNVLSFRSRTSPSAPSEVYDYQARLLGPAVAELRGEREAAGPGPRPRSPRRYGDQALPPSLRASR